MDSIVASGGGWTVRVPTFALSWLPPPPLLPLPAPQLTFCPHFPRNVGLLPGFLQDSSPQSSGSRSKLKGRVLVVLGRASGRGGERWRGCSFKQHPVHSDPNNVLRHHCCSVYPTLRTGKPGSFFNSLLPCDPT